MCNKKKSVAIYVIMWTEKKVSQSRWWKGRKRFSKWLTRINKFISLIRPNCLSTIQNYVGGRGSIKNKILEERNNFSLTEMRIYELRKEWNKITSWKLERKKDILTRQSFEPLVRCTTNWHQAIIFTWRRCCFLLAPEDENFLFMQFSLSL